MSKILLSTCLKPQYSLRRQLLVTFGSISVLSISIALMLAILAAQMAGEIVPDEARDSLSQQVYKSVHLTSRQIAELISRKFEVFDGVASLQSYIVQDRIVGYPDMGWENDTHVPFFDVLSQRRAYPFNAPLLPRDWSVSGNVYPGNAKEHVQERVDLLEAFASMVGVIDTSTAVYRFQGNCDPSKTNVRDRAYYPNCTDANNDVATGGVVVPVESNKHLAQKASDISFILKPIWESHPELLTLDIGFHNSGAGSLLTFPSFHADGTSSYKSDGCDWMMNTNPLTGRPYATLEEIARCRPRGTIVNERDYNPLEREWCADQALHPNEARTFGPFRSTGNQLWLLAFGKAVFDRMTGEFIACSSASIELTMLKEVLDVRSIQKYTESMLVKPDGTIVLSETERWDHFTSPSLMNVVDTDFISKEIFDQFLTLWNFDKSWTRDEMQERLERNWESTDKEVIASVPIPPPPEEYDENYRPRYFLLLSIGDEVFSPIDQVEDAVQDDVRNVVATTVAIGLLGLVIVLVVVWTVSRVLTLPLKWMEGVAWRIVNHNDERAAGALHLTSMTIRGGSPILVRFSPKTEINELVSEFRTMIKGFSGTGASRVASKAVNEVYNNMSWQNEFQELYSHLSARRGTKDEEEGGEACTESSTVSSTQFPSKPPAKVPSSPKFEEAPALQAVVVSEQAATIKASNDQSVQTASSMPLKIARMDESRSKSPDVNDDSSVLDEMNDDDLSYVSEIPIPTRSNKGPNAVSSLDRQEEERLKMHLRAELDRQQTKVWRSKLLWWIVQLIILPLLLTNVAICIKVTYAIQFVLPSWIGILRSASFDIEKEMLEYSSKLKASFTETVMIEPVRDLHLLTRTAGWLLFDAIAYSGSFIEVIATTELCKSAEFGECEIYDDPYSAPCDCEWKDPRPLQCWSYEEETRYLQKSFMCGQSQDADPETGDRFNVSFPLTDTSPNETSWWVDIFELPGASRGIPPRGYKTTFDRVGVLSAMSVVNVAIYNYVQQLDRSKHDLGGYFGFENDGMFTGYSGCSYEFSEMSKFQVTKENKAYLFGGTDICPIGKWGYDARCRGWYADGRDHALNGGGVLITAPYLFASGREVATSATSAIFDPFTGQHVGQTLLDFTPVGIFSHLENGEDIISIVISSNNADASGGDTLFGPQLTGGADPIAIGDVVLPNDDKHSHHRKKFEEEIVLDMKAGGSGLKGFSRTEDDGTIQNYVMAYNPVKIRALKPTQPDDFSRGAELIMELIYSIGIAYPNETLRKPYEEIDGEIREEHSTLLTVYLCLVVMVLVFVSIFTFVASVSITSPMIILLRVVQNVNAGRIEDDIPPMKGGSAEVNQVYNSFAKLFKIVRVSNSAFFSGNLKWSYHFVSNALQLFRKVNDRKAIGIACNNLGNTMLVMYSEKPATNVCCTVDGLCMAKRGKELLDEAIEIGTREFEGECSDLEKADYAQQLANRHFNRGMFLLHCQYDPCVSFNAKALGYADLVRARQLDGDVRDFWLEKKLMLKNSAEYFDRMIRRVRGLIELYHDERVRDVWDAREIIDELDRLLLAAWDQPSAPLFRGMSRVGRLQQVEDGVIRLEMSLQNVTEAACHGIRMLVEDEYILETSFISAANALLSYMRMSQPSSWRQEAVFTTKSDLRRILKSCKGQTLDAGKCLILCIELSDTWRDDHIVSIISQNCMRLYDEFMIDQDYVGLISGSADDDMCLQLKKKCEQRRALFESASKVACGEIASPSIPIAVEMVVGSPATLDNDTFVVAVIDGTAWTSFSSAPIKRQIDQLNRQRNTKVNVIIIGLNLGAGDVKIAENCQDLCLVSHCSVFLRATLDTIDQAFAEAASIISGRSAKSGCILGGVTMEKF